MLFALKSSKTRSNYTIVKKSFKDWMHRALVKWECVSFSWIFFSTYYFWVIYNINICETEKQKQNIRRVFLLCVWDFVECSGRSAQVLSVWDHDFYHLRSRLNKNNSITITTIHIQHHTNTTSTIIFLYGNYERILSSTCDVHTIFSRHTYESINIKPNNCIGSFLHWT